MSEVFVAVAVPAPLLEPLTYAVPPDLAHAAVPGVRVRVTLRGRRVDAVVLGPSGPPPEGITALPIESVLDDPDRPALPPDVLETVRWTAEYYLAPPGEVVRAALPAALAPPRRGATEDLPEAGRGAAAGFAPPSLIAWLAGRPGGAASRASALARVGGRADVLAKFAAGGLIAIVEDGEARGAPVRRRVLEPARSTLANPDRARAELSRSPARRAALEAALSGPPRTAMELARAAEVSPGAVAALVRDGWLVERQETLAPNVLPALGLDVTEPATLTPEQEAAVAHLAARVDAGTFHAALLFGVTGSGKTEVYLRAARHTLERGRSVLLLVPEIGLAPHLAEALHARLGIPVAVLHSGMSDRQRHHGWSSVQEGRARVVVGARSALFAPLRAPGLIVVDEEHDAGYKQADVPRYHARDLALVRGRAAGAVVLLGSATPSIEAWTRAAAGQFALLELPRRVGSGTLAHATLIDMREEFRETRSAAPLSRALVAALRETLKRGEQAMVLINRRGYARALLCRACGEPVACNACSVPLTWHRVGERLRCHYCGFARPRPDTCPSCASPHLAEIGEGTQRAEEELAAALPGARIARLDRDAVRSPYRLADILGAFGRGAIDVLVGTQMIAKGHHFPRVTLVGVLSADATLRLPDFRAAERTFQLLTQVAGRSGRGDRPGAVIVQAFRPEHPVLGAALDQDYRSFARREAAAREVLRYPPAAALANVIVRDEDQAVAAARAEDFAQRVRAAGEGNVAVLGPTAAPLARLAGFWRVQLLLRARKRRRLNDALRRALAEVGSDGVPPRWLAVDIDPYALL